MTNESFCSCGVVHRNSTLKKQTEGLFQICNRLFLDICNINRTLRPLIGQNQCYQSVKRRKSVFYSFSPHCLYIIKQAKKALAVAFDWTFENTREMYETLAYSSCFRVYISLMFSNSRHVLSQCNTRGFYKTELYLRMTTTTENTF